jgi:hypothetical protein
MTVIIYKKVGNSIPSVFDFSFGHKLSSLELQDELLGLSASIFCNNAFLGNVPFTPSAPFPYTITLSAQVVRKLTFFLANIALRIILVGINIDALLAFGAFNISFLNSVRTATHITAVVSTSSASQSRNILGLASQALHIVYWWFATILSKSKKGFQFFLGDRFFIHIIKFIQKIYTFPDSLKKYGLKLGVLNV